MIKIKIFSFIICFLSSSALLAQGNYGGGVDDETIHLGFNFRYVNSDYKIKKKTTWRNPFFEDGVQVTDSLNSIRSVSNPGFGFGFVTDLYLHPNANLRLTPTFVLGDRVVDYEFADGATYEQEGVTSPAGFTRRSVPATMFEIPLSLKIKSDRQNNFRAYVMGGVKYGIDISSKKKSEDSGFLAINKLLKNKKGILSYEVGIGFDIYFEYFKLSPEIKLSNSFNSVLKDDFTPYSTPIEKMFLRNLAFSLYIE